MSYDDDRPDDVINDEMEAVKDDRLEENLVDRETLLEGCDEAVDGEEDEDAEEEEPEFGDAVASVTVERFYMGEGRPLGVRVTGSVSSEIALAMLQLGVVRLSGIVDEALVEAEEEAEEEFEAAVEARMAAASAEKTDLTLVDGPVKRKKTK